MKKNKNLFDSIGDISEKYISEAAPKNAVNKPNKKITMLKSICAAACFAVIVGLQYQFFIKPLSDIKNSKSESFNRGEMSDISANVSDTNAFTCISETSIITSIVTEIPENSNIYGADTGITSEHDDKIKETAKVSDLTTSVSKSDATTVICSDKPLCSEVPNVTSKPYTPETTKSVTVTTSVSKTDITTGICSGVPLYSETQTQLPAVTQEPDERVTGYIAPEYPLDLKVQYVRTNGYIEGKKYPNKIIITSIEELEMYYNENKDKYCLEYDYDNFPSFIRAVSKYDEQFFKDHDLIFVLLEEGSGSIRHEVKEISCERSTLDITQFFIKIAIERQILELCTDDMAEWHIIIEVDKEYEPLSSNDIILDITQGTRVY